MSNKYKRVIDVSENNGDCDFGKLSANADAVIIRAGYRGYGAAGTLVTDSCFIANMNKAAIAGLPVGVYWVSQAVNVMEAKEEAAYLLHLLDGYEITYPVYLDSEYSGKSGNTGRGDLISRAQRTQNGLAFLSALQDAGYKPGLYCSESWFSDMLEGRQFAKAGYTLWIAKYSSTKPTIGYEYDAWQYSSTGTLSGNGSDDIDKSYFYRDFEEEYTMAQMTYEQFKAYMGQYNAELAAAEPSAWSAEARAWAENNGIIKGDENGNKQYKAPCTREQMVTFLQRAHNLK